jgi:hypothetical protein
MQRKAAILLLISFFASFLFIGNVGLIHAAGDDISFGISSNLPVLDNNVQDGAIVVTSSQGFFLSTKEYDTGIVGVATLNPAVSINIEDESTNTDNTSPRYPVVSSGNAVVQVTTANGSIKKGDLITSSSTKGVGMKATKTGYVLGSALEDYLAEDKNAVKKINVALNIHYYNSKASNTSSQLSDIFKLSAIATTEEPLTVFKYIMAAVVLVLSFVFGFMSFGRAARSGIEALGRNPLAGKLIQVGIVINTVITVAIVAAGVLISLFILRL